MENCDHVWESLLSVSLDYRHIQVKCEKCGVRGEIQDDETVLWPVS